MKAILKGVAFFISLIKIAYLVEKLKAMKKIVFFGALLLVITQAVFAQSWSLAGNAAVSGNVLGTTNAFPLNFVLDGRKGGIVEGTYTGSHYNTGIGYLSLQSASGSNPPIENTALGYAALGGAQLTGSFNVANGATTLQYNTTGQYNTGIGRQTLNYNTTGSYNLANGGQSLFTNVTGSNNTAVGYGSLFNSTVSNLTAVGYQSLYSNTIGVGNVAVGYQSLYLNTTGVYNTTNGYQSLYSNTSGFDNTANGAQALYSNTTGEFNTAGGTGALYSNTTGSYNTANGSQSLYFNTIGNYNTANGSGALYSNTTGSSNTSNGYVALNANLTGNENTAEGYYADVNAGNYTDAGAFGSYATATASYQVRIGDLNVTSIGGYANWTNISDGRVKKNIQQNVPGLTFINQLQPVTYNLDLDAVDKIVQRPVMKDKDGNAAQPTQEQMAARTAKEGIVYTGFIAQDVEKAAQKVNYNFSGVDPAKNSKDLYGLRYAEFVVPLVKAVQELNDSLKQTNTALNTKVDTQQKQLDSQQQQLNDLKNTIAQMRSAMSQCCNSFSSTMQPAVSDQQISNIPDQPKLDQNVPNPFNGSSYISYYIPQGFHSAQLMVVDISGNVLKTYALANSGYGKRVISGSEMAAGMYQYSLLIDGKLIDTKKMVKAN